MTLERVDRHEQEVTVTSHVQIFLSTREQIATDDTQHETIMIEFAKLHAFVTAAVNRVFEKNAASRKTSTSSKHRTK